MLSALWTVLNKVIELLFWLVGGHELREDWERSRRLKRWALEAERWVDEAETRAWRQEDAAGSESVGHLLRWEESIRLWETSQPGSADDRPSMLPRPLESWPVQSWWLRLSAAVASWYAAQGQLDEWEEVCEKVRQKAPLTMRRAQSWSHNELAAIARQRGDLATAERWLAEAARHRSPRGRAQDRHNTGLVNLDRGMVALAEDDLELARSLRTRGDTTGKALTDLALGAVGILQAEASDEPSEQRLDQVARRLEQAWQCFSGEDHLLPHEEADESSDRPRARKGHIRLLRAEAAAQANLVLAHWAVARQKDAASEHETAADRRRLAREAGNRALKTYRVLNDHLDRDDRLGRATALLNLGAVLVWGSEDEIDRGTELLCDGVRLRNELLEERRRDKLLTEIPLPRLLAGKGRSYLYLGDAARRQNDLSKAREHWEQAGDICAEAEDEPGLAASVLRLTQARSCEST